MGREQIAQGQKLAGDFQPLKVSLPNAQQGASGGNPLADLAYFCMCLRLPAVGHIPGLLGKDRGEHVRDRRSEIVDGELQPFEP